MERVHGKTKIDRCEGTAEFAECVSKYVDRISKNLQSLTPY